MKFYGAATLLFPVVSAFGGLRKPSCVYRGSADCYDVCEWDSLSGQCGDKSVTCHSKPETECFDLDPCEWNPALFECGDKTTCTSKPQTECYDACMWDSHLGKCGDKS